jgi:cell division protein FtsX
MIRVAYGARELARSLYRHPGTAIASVLSLTLLFLMFDIFWVAAGTSGRFYRNLLSEIRVEVYLHEAVPDSSVAVTTAHLLSVEGVAGAEYVSREAARERLAGMIGTDLLVGYENANPLPRSFMLMIDEAHLNTEAMQQMEIALRDLPGVADLNYSRRWLEKAESTKSLVLEIGLILGVLILATALISSANNIRLMTRTGAVGFRQLLLLGAGRTFIAMPFIAEGFLVSAFSAVLSWAVVFYGHTRVQFSQIEIVIPSLQDIGLFCLAAGVLGALSGLLGLRTSLRE